MLSWRILYAPSRTADCGRLAPEQARSEARKLLVSVFQGADPSEQRQQARQAETIAALGKVLAELERESVELPSVIAAVRLLVLTGARLSEILTRRWSTSTLSGSACTSPTAKPKSSWPKPLSCVLAFPQAEAVGARIAAVMATKSKNADNVVTFERRN